MNKPNPPIKDMPTSGIKIISTEKIPSHETIIKTQQLLHSTPSTFFVAPPELSPSVNFEDGKTKVEVPIPTLSPQLEQQMHFTQANAFLQRANGTLYENNNKYREKYIQEKKKKRYLCSCKKSKCLKLYCDCFANGEFCIDCSCTECENVLGNDALIRKCYADVKDKNPSAMKTSINNEKDFGCNCTKSNCLKKYCECFKAGKHCNESCRCRDCENVPKGKEFPVIDETSKDPSAGHKQEGGGIPLCSNGFISKPIKNLQEDENIYEDFCFEKISVQIQEGAMVINKKEPVGQLDTPKPEKKENTLFPNNSIAVRIIDHQTCLEIPKSLLNSEVLNELNSLKDFSAQKEGELDFGFGFEYQKESSQLGKKQSRSMSPEIILEENSSPMDDNN